MNMRYGEIKILCWAVLSFFLFSCEKDEPDIVTTSRKTLFMYLPWSSNLTTNFYTNISDMEECIKKRGLKDEKVVVFMSSSSTEASMFEIVYKNGKCERKTLKSYTNPSFTTAEGITSILNDMKTFAPASIYAMTIGCHGMGWLPVDRMKTMSVSSVKMHWDYEGKPLTRYFGGLTSEYQTDISTLAKGIADAGIKMEYILFDDCYMSSIEVAYELRNVADYLIASASEIMAYGMPYAVIGEYLLDDLDFQAVCDGFYDFYSAYSMPYGTLAVTVCAELEDLATIMKKINTDYIFDESSENALQRMDGYTPIIFYDYGDYVEKLCKDPVLLERFEQQLSRAVPYKVHTDYFYSVTKGRVPIYTFSGITTSDPSKHSLTVSKNDTEWYRATH